MRQKVNKRVEKSGIKRMWYLLSATVTRNYKRKCLLGARYS
ncbi:hypothetical protein [Enterobacter ludwigii]